VAVESNQPKEMVDMLLEHVAQHAAGMNGPYKCCTQTVCSTYVDLGVKLHVFVVAGAVTTSTLTLSAVDYASIDEHSRYTDSVVTCPVHDEVSELQARRGEDKWGLAEG